MGPFLVSFLYFILNYKTLHMYQKYTNKKSSVKLTSDHISSPSLLSFSQNKLWVQFKNYPHISSLPSEVCHMILHRLCKHCSLHKRCPRGSCKTEHNYPYQPQNYCTEISGFHCDSHFYIFTTNKDYI